MGIFTLLSSWQSLNAKLPILVISLGIVMLVKFSQYINAFSPISVSPILFSLYPYFFALFTFFNSFQINVVPSLNSTLPLLFLLFFNNNFPTITIANIDTIIIINLIKVSPLLFLHLYYSTLYIIFKYSLILKYP